MSAVESNSSTVSSVCAIWASQPPAQVGMFLEGIRRFSLHACDVELYEDINLLIAVNNYFVMGGKHG